MPIHILILAILSFASAPALAQSTNPECVYQSSDFDGDGYGYENNTTCLVTENSSSVGGFSSNECIDDNADGWGWNGTSSCQVPIVQTECIDTDPIGDGWGWDGSTSCRVVPAADTFDELEELKQRLSPHPDLDFSNNTASAFHCPAFSGQSEITYYLFFDGSLRTSLGQGGVWTSGMSSTNGLLRMLITTTSGGFILPMYLVEDRVVLFNRETGRVCEWIDPQ